MVISGIVLQSCVPRLIMVTREILWNSPDTHTVDCPKSLVHRRILSTHHDCCCPSLYYLHYCIIWMDRRRDTKKTSICEFTSLIFSYASYEENVAYIYYQYICPWIFCYALYLSLLYCTLLYSSYLLFSLPIPLNRPSSLPLSLSLIDIHPTVSPHWPPLSPHLLYPNPFFLPKASSLSL